MKIVAYVDGSCLTNPGFAGWGVYLQRTMNGKKQSRMLSGSDPCATNNMMEMQAAIEALRAVSPEHSLTIYTDSQYVQKGMTEWVRGWERNGWKTSVGIPVKNADRWIQLRALSKNRSVEWCWVKGHNGNKGNEIADKLAGEAARRLKKESDK